MLLSFTRILQYLTKLHLASQSPILNILLILSLVLYSFPYLSGPAVFETHPSLECLLVLYLVRRLCRPNTVVTTAPTPDQAELYKARVTFSINFAFFLVIYYFVFSYFNPEVALVLSCFVLAAMQDMNLTISSAVADEFLARLAARLGVPTAVAMPAPSPASTPVFANSATPVFTSTPASSAALKGSNKAPWRGRPLVDPFLNGTRVFSTSVTPLYQDSVTGQVDPTATDYC